MDTTTPETTAPAWETPFEGLETEKQQGVAYSLLQGLTGTVRDAGIAFGYNVMTAAKELDFTADEVLAWVREGLERGLTSRERARVVFDEYATKQSAPATLEGLLGAMGLTLADILQGPPEETEDHPT